MRILGAVLAGGASSRFGSDKAVAVLDGETLMARAMATLAPFVETVVVVGRDGGVPDAPAPGLGPLGGIAGALVHAEQEGFASVMTIACDMPWVPEVLLGQLIDSAPAYCSDAPVLGHWATSLATSLLNRLGQSAPSPRPRAGVHSSARASALDFAAPWMLGRARHDGRLSVRRWATDIGATPVASARPLRNINTPADLATS